MIYHFNQNTISICKKINVHRTELYLKDLAYLNFCMSFLKTTLNDLKENRDNKNKTINQKLQRRLENIIDERNKINPHLNNQDVIRVNTFYKKLFKKLILLCKDRSVELNIELFATYIFYCRFREKRIKILNNDFEYFADLKKIFSLADFICQIDNIDVEDEIIEYKIAYQIVKVL